MAIHIGQIIKKVLEEKKISPSKLAAKLGVHAGTISRMFHYRHMHTTALTKISLAIEHDFFKYYSNDLKIKGDQANAQSQSMDNIYAQIRTLQQDVDQLKIKNK